MAIRTVGKIKSWETSNLIIEIEENYIWFNKYVLLRIFRKTHRNKKGARIYVIAKRIPISLFFNEERELYRWEEARKQIKKIGDKKIQHFESKYSKA